MYFCVWAFNLFMLNYLDSHKNYLLTINVCSITGNLYTVEFLHPYFISTVILFWHWTNRISLDLTITLALAYTVYLFHLIDSFLRCIPKSFAKHISRDNFLTKLRIRRVFAEFVQKFQQHTVAKGLLGSQKIMYKYISTLEHLAPQFGTETFCVSNLELRKGGDGSSSYSITTTQAQGCAKDNFTTPITHEIRVSGTKGIQWRKVSGQKVCQNAI